MPIADLLQLKERLGAKIYDEVMFGDSKSTKVTQKKFARENKNRPMEMSSRKPVPFGQPDVQSKKHAFVARDPRFDDLSGEFNESYFKQSYGFLSDIKLREKQKLLKMLKKTKDAKKSAQLQQLITRMTQQEKAEREREEKHQREQAWKKKERERISQGKRPFFLKKSEKRKVELAEKFRKLEQSGKLEQFIAKKKKKNLRTEQKSIPQT